MASLTQRHCGTLPEVQIHNCLAPVDNGVRRACRLGRGVRDVFARAPALPAGYVAALTPGRPVIGGLTAVDANGCSNVGHVAQYLQEVREVCSALSAGEIEALCDELVALRGRGGRLFVLGVGGSAANASHAVNDFRKLCGIEAYAPTDNVSELSARTNDEGWPTVFVEWLKISRIGRQDAVLVLSVGGGNLERNVSPNIVSAVAEAKARGARVLGIVGRDGGYTKQVGDVVVLVPTAAESRVTPHAEAFQSVIWHCLVSHPKLQLNPTKW